MTRVQRAVAICVLGFVSIMALVGCGRPPEVTQAAGIVVTHTQQLKNAAEFYVNSLNSDRERNEARLDDYQARAIDGLQEVEEIRTLWRMDGNKEALALFDVIRARDEQIRKDPIAAAGYSPLVKKAQFDRAKADTAAYDAIIKNISGLKTDRTWGERLNLSVDFGEQVLKDLEEMKDKKTEK